MILRVQAVRGEGSAIVEHRTRVSAEELVITLGKKSADIVGEFRFESLKYQEPGNYPDLSSNMDIPIYIPRLGMGYCSDTDAFWRQIGGDYDKRGYWIEGYSDSWSLSKQTFDHLFSLKVLAGDEKAISGFFIIMRRRKDKDAQEWLPIPNCGVSAVLIGYGICRDLIERKDPIKIRYKQYYSKCDNWLYFVYTPVFARSDYKDAKVADNAPGYSVKIENTEGWVLASKNIVLKAEKDKITLRPRHLETIVLKRRIY